MQYALKDSRGVSHVDMGDSLVCVYLASGQTLLQVVERDDNVQTLLEAIQNDFELAEEADTLRNIQPESKQAKILYERLECVCKSAEFIESYAKDVQVGMSL